MGSEQSSLYKPWDDHTDKDFVRQTRIFFDKCRKRTETEGCKHAESVWNDLKSMATYVDGYTDERMKKKEKGEDVSMESIGEIRRLIDIQREIPRDAYLELD